MAFTQGHALLIGVGTHQYEPRIDVPITVDDAKAVAAVLKDANLCGYPEAQVKVIHDADATKQGILDELDEIAKLVGDNDTVFLFYAGHGALGEDSNFYLVSHDAKVKGDRVVNGTGVSEGELLKKLHAIKARRALMIFNACFSGNISPTLALDDGTPSLATSNPAVDTLSALLGTGQGRIIITACREEQKSYIGSGSLTIFTQALVDGLRGKGVVRRKGFISAYDLYEAIFQQQQSGGVNFGQGNTFNGPVAGGNQENYDLCASQGAVIKPQGPVTQTFGPQVDTGGGAYVGGGVNTGGGDFTGRDKITHGDQITTGTVSGMGIAIGSHASANVSTGIDAGALGAALAPVAEAVRQSGANAATQEQALQMIEQLKQELAKANERADDGRVSTVLKGLTDLVPGAVSAVVSSFATPVIGGLVGPVTKIVLDSLLRRK